jgi:D-3-phosphoglycerate dehydrogenase
MPAFRVVVTDRFDGEAMALLQSDSKLSVAKSAEPTPSAMELADANGLIVRSRTKITKELLAKAPKLEVIVTSTSGYDHVDLEACRERGVIVMYTPDANAASAAELTWALTLAALRKTHQAEKHVQSGDWKRESLLGRQLSGSTYGIVGLGRIGTRVARIASAFGMRVIAFDPYKDDAHFKAAGCERADLAQVFKTSAVVSMHVPSTEETFHMISKSTLANANRDLVFVNTSRGSVVEESVVVEALDQGWIAGAGLDVFEKEPLPTSSKLMGRDNVVLTPHIGATTNEAFKASSMEAAKKVQAFASHREITNRLPGN